MLFNSYIFIFIFLPIVLAGWYGLNKAGAHKLAMLFLSIMSLYFYGYFNPIYLLIIIGSIIVNYSLSLLFQYTNSRISNLFGLLIGVFFNIGLLFYYKYYDFFIDNINHIFNSSFAFKNILLPLGISFFTFQQLSYIVDRYKRKAKHYSFVNYITFVTFFPQLVAGPIVLYDEMMPQFEDFDRRRFNIDSFAKGYLLFAIGIAKKVLLADTLAYIVNYGYDNSIFLDSLSTYIVALFYTFELYFDFSGYSDMAMGLAKMLNIDLPQNFNSPYKACNMKEFWRRWHITLTRFFTNYVYIPLGGNRKGTSRKLLNIFIVFFLSGLWHGANWTFVVWGIMNGFGVIWDNLYLLGAKSDESARCPKIMIPALLGQILTFHYYLLSMLAFRADNLSISITMFKKLFSFTYTGSIKRLFEYADIPENYIFRQALSIVRPQFSWIIELLTIIILIAICIIVITRKNAKEIVLDNEPTKRTFVWATVLLFLSVISFSQVSTFIYFNF